MISEEVSVKPVDEIIRVGTKTRDAKVSDNEDDNSDGDKEVSNNENDNSDEDKKVSSNNGIDSDNGEEISKTGNDNNKEMTTKADSKDDGNQLPNTATSIYNWIAGGFIALIAGIIGIFTARRKVVKEQ